ncbi:ATP-dependent DNA helicase DinG [Clostridium cavendishii DSM 21758]|uniref:DNA 5'-3' helicase n=1 Tax=Clostridium cavendishii DSM 21758 TaxID=1121302 RepID=A0A1M6VKE0_9CLOT|nr:helicase C-terminal domain-containing protein [Clostridium cavendishii]SHK81960.1 ATP-dependent DNA helicase DinG [Clostridium cavendishii DSM 21758]
MTKFNTINLNELKSYFKNVVYLDIETSGLNASLYGNKSKSEILEIGAIKFTDGTPSVFHTFIRPKFGIPETIFDLCEDLNAEDLNNGIDISEALFKLSNFLEDLPLICHKGKFQHAFLTSYYREHSLNFKNEILDTMELFALLEPYHKEFNLDYFIKQKLSGSLNYEKNRALEDAKDTILVLNQVLENNNITIFLNDYSINLLNWNWLSYLTNYSTHVETEKIFKGSMPISSINMKTERKKIGNLKLIKECEESLKDIELWKEISPNYIFRKAQYEVTKNVRKSINQKAFSIMEAPTGTGKSVAYLLPSIYSALHGERVFISTNTKELQNQLVSKDIPNLLNAFNLNNKLDYKVIKGKNNYICPEVLDDLLKHSLSNQLPDRLGLVYLHRYASNGKFGDIEDINQWVVDNFNLKPVVTLCNAGNDGCDINSCSRLCFYKESIEALDDTNLIILNHALLLRWPYKQEIKNVILDEAHNLRDLLFEVYAERISSLDIIKLLDEIVSKDGQGALVYVWRSLKNKENSSIDKIREYISSAKASIDAIGKVSKENMNLLYNLDISFNKDFANYSKVLTAMKILIEDLNLVYRPLKKLIDYNNLDDENSKNKKGIILVKKCDKLKAIIDFLNSFIMPEEEFKCNGFVCNKDSFFWEAYIKDLNPANYFCDRFLKTLDSCVFLSATLKTSGKYEDLKKALAINSVEDKQTIEITDIDNTFDLKKRAIICATNDNISYDSSNFISYLVENILKLTSIVPGNILVLFTSKNRQENFKNLILPELNKRHIRLYENKKDVVHLKDRSKKSVLIGSKGFFEGIDVAGDGLNCVVLEKLPNISPTDPLFKKLISKQKVDYAYGEINEPRVLTSFKQCFGRLIRTEYDFGYFLVMDGGTNSRIWSKIGKEYPGVRLYHSSIDSIIKSMPNNYKSWESMNFDKLILETKEQLATELKKVNFKDYKILEDTLNDFYKTKFKEKKLTKSINLYIENKSINAYHESDNSQAYLKNKNILFSVLKSLI